jgi:guanine deaminase
MSHEEIMHEKIHAALESARAGRGPFAALIAREGRVIGAGTDHVAADNDPTAHAERTNAPSR